MTLLRNMLGELGSFTASMMFIWAIFKQYFPEQVLVWIERKYHKVQKLFNPYIEITFSEFSNNQLNRSQAYAAIETYLSGKSSSQAKRLKADLVNGRRSLVLSIGDYEEVTDEFKDVKVYWAASKHVPSTKTISLYPSNDEKRFYRLTFHKRYREIVTGSYLVHVLNEGKSMTRNNRQRKLFTNAAGEKWYGSKKSHWSHVIFEHPATFETLAMDMKKKEEIVSDLIKFSKSKEYYAKIGKPWKRGYLLYGPPGTGKSTMIAAMANLLGYDVYDLELTSVSDNTELRKLLIEISSKSIIVIEDIDCSLDLTGQRKTENDVDDKSEEDDLVPKDRNRSERKSSKVTLSGLLNIIDGLWSACEGERLVVFTTNYVGKLDPALIRRGRMDKHIEMSYCGFEAFKVLVKNYWDIESHHLFNSIRCLLEEVNISPADVAENLMPKSLEDDAESCLRDLVGALKAAKEEARLNAENGAAKEKESLMAEPEAEKGSLEEDEELKKNQKG